MTVTGLSRVAIPDAADHQPPVWTILDFEAREQDIDRLSGYFATHLDSPGWYLDMHTKAEVFVVFPQKVFRYMRGDEAGRLRAVEHARTVGVPEAQCDWA